MAEGERSTPPVAKAPDADERSLFARFVGALEVLVSAHAALARVEARNDVARIVSGLSLAAAALALSSIALVLGHALLVLALESELGWGRLEAIAAAATADLAAALLLVLVARARLRAPVLVETRAMLAKATSTLRG